MIACPDWFPLQVYSTDVSLREWVDLLAMRLAIAAKHRNGVHSKEEMIDTFMKLVVDKGPIVNSGLVRSDDMGKASFWPIQSPSHLEILYASGIIRERGRANPELASVINSVPGSVEGFAHAHFATDWGRALQKIDINALGGDAWKDWPDVVGGPFAMVTVDLDMSDETLIAAFQVWLAGIRDSWGRRYESDLDEKALKRWKTFRVLAAIDLRLWSEVSGQNLTDTAIAQLLWDDTDGVDPTERYRKTVKPMANEMFSWSFWARLVRQIEFTEALLKIAGKFEERKSDQETRDGAGGGKKRAGKSLRKKKT